MDDGPSVLDRCFAGMRLDLPVDVYHRLPRHPAYKYELIDGTTWLSPRPTSRDVRRSTAPPYREPDDPSDDPSDELPWGVRVRAYRDGDADALPVPFAAAFERTVPFCTLDEGALRTAAADAVAETLGGRHGPLLADVSSVAIDAEGRAFGAGLVTRAPDTGGPFPEEMRGRPYLTWIFVVPLLSRHGLARAMLHRALEALHRAGEPALYSTFLVGNERSALWHWDNGFELLPSPWALARRRVARGRGGEGSRGGDDAGIEGRQ